MIKINRIFIILVFFRILEYLIFQTYRTWILDVGERLLIYLFNHQKRIRLLTNLAILLRLVFVLSPIFCCCTLLITSMSGRHQNSVGEHCRSFQRSNYSDQGYCSTAEDDFTMWLAFWRQSNRLAITLYLKLANHLDLILN